MTGENENVVTLSPTDERAEPVAAPADVAPTPEVVAEPAPAVPETAAAAPAASEPAPAPKAEEPKCDCAPADQRYARLGNVRNAGRLDFKRTCEHRATKVGGELLTADEAVTLRALWDERAPAIKAEMVADVERRRLLSGEELDMSFTTDGLDAVAAKQAEEDERRKAARRATKDAEVKAFLTGTIVGKLVVQVVAKKREEQKCSFPGCHRQFDGRPFDYKGKRVQHFGGFVGVYLEKFRAAPFAACHYHYDVVCTASRTMYKSGKVPRFLPSQKHEEIVRYLTEGPVEARSRVGTHGRTRDGGKGGESRGGSAASGGANGQGGSKPSGSSASAQTVVVERRGFHMPDDREDRGAAGNIPAGVDLSEIDELNRKPGRRSTARAERANGGR